MGNSLYPYGDQCGDDLQNGKSRPLYLLFAAFCKPYMADNLFQYAKLSVCIYLAPSFVGAGYSHDNGILQNQQDRRIPTASLPFMADLCRIPELFNLASFKLVIPHMPPVWAVFF